MNIGKIEDDGKKVSKPLPFTVRYAEVELAEIKGRIIRNPAYSNDKVSIYGWCWTPELSQARKPQFRAAMAESLRSEGYRNPVILFSCSEGLFLSFGGSRVSVGLSAGLARIPAIINDYNGAFGDAPEVTDDNWDSFFTDVPEYHEFTDTGFETHYSLERNRRDHYDPAGMAWADGEEFIKHEFPWIKE